MYVAAESWDFFGQKNHGIFFLVKRITGFKILYCAEIYKASPLIMNVKWIEKFGSIF